MAVHAAASFPRATPCLPNATSRAGERGTEYVADFNTCEDICGTVSQPSFSNRHAGRHDASHLHTSGARGPRRREVRRDRLASLRGPLRKRVLRATRCRRLRHSAAGGSGSDFLAPRSVHHGDVLGGLASWLLGVWLGRMCLGCVDVLGGALVAGSFGECVRSWLLWLGLAANVSGRGSGGCCIV